MELEKKKLPERLLLGLLQTKAEAMRQIEDNDYISLLKQHGIQESTLTESHAIRKPARSCIS